MVVDGDDLKPYKVLYLADQNVSERGAKAIAEWVQQGGRLVATAGAGMFDELNRPNKILRGLLGVDQVELVKSTGEPIVFSKQDLPFAEELDEATLADGAKVPVFGVRSRLKATDAAVAAKFRDGSPALTTKVVGKGTAAYVAFMPGLSYFHPAIPKRPMDRGATDEHMTHFIPTEFHTATAKLIGDLVGEFDRPVVCSNNLVESTVIQAKQGTLIPLVNWTARPIQGLEVSVNLTGLGQNITLASGRTVQVKRDGGRASVTLDLDVADALIVR
jgi:hypothetical protein